MTRQAGESERPPSRSNPVPGPGGKPTEDADISTSSDDYALRFAGAVGRWFLETQSRITLGLLGALPAGATLLDVGGGHAQIAPALIEAGYEVTVVGSDQSCGGRLQAWLSSGRCRFEVADLHALPYPDKSFDAVLCFRLLPHSVSWTALIRELCRVAARSVVVDYPSSRSVNILSSPLFQFKRGIELNTRPFLTFSPREIRSAFGRSGFAVTAERPQFLLPMALHRWLDRASLSKAAEGPPRRLGLTRRFGSPVIVRADRRPSV